MCLLYLVRILLGCAQITRSIRLVDLKLLEVKLQMIVMSCQFLAIKLSPLQCHILQLRQVGLTSSKYSLEAT